MKTKLVVFLFLTALLLPFSSRAVTNLQISVQSSNVVLTIPSIEGENFIVAYRATLDTNTTWQILTNDVPAAVGTNQTTFVHYNQVTPHESFSSSASIESPDWKTKEKNPPPPFPWDQTTWSAPSSSGANGFDPQLDGDDPVVEMGFYFVVEYAEDTDGDGLDNATELVLGTDLLVPEDLGTSPLEDGGVFSGEVEITFSPSSSYTNILGPMLYADGVLANSLITTEPSSNVLRMNWHTVFVHTEGFASPDGPSPTPPQDAPNFTGDEARLLHDAFGEGTTATTLSKPNQAKVDLLPRELLERYEQAAAASVRQTFQLIQKANKGEFIPAGGLESFMRLRIAFTHTQFTRMQSITKSLASRFGRAANKVLPFLGGIIILANADSISANFLSAMNAYARDIGSGEDETGSAAILAGYCNDLAPGSGNIVLNYLLR